MNYFQKRACVESERLSRGVIPTKLSSNIIRHRYIIKANIHPGLLSNIWKRKPKVFEFSKQTKQTNKRYISRILKKF